MVDNYGPPPQHQEIKAASTAITDTAVLTTKTSISDEIENEPILKVILDIFDGEIL